MEESAAELLITMTALHVGAPQPDDSEPGLPLAWRQVARRAAPHRPLRRWAWHERGVSGMGGGGDRVERRRRLLRDGSVGWISLVGRE